ncbi:MAG: hypothetical protein Q8R18_05045 [bacterium]|nr:hypothetical protein [bacterium]
MADIDMLTEARALLEQGKSTSEVRKILSRYPDSKQNIIDEIVKEALQLCTVAGTLPQQKKIIVVPIRRGVQPSVVNSNAGEKPIIYPPATPVIVKEDETGNGYKDYSMGVRDDVTTYEELRKNPLFPLGLTLGAIGLGALVYGLFYDHFKQPIPEPGISLEQTISPLPLPLEINREKEEEKINIPVITEKEEKKIFKYDEGTITINPIPGYGLTTYAALLAEKDINGIAALSWDEQKQLLKKQRAGLAEASKADLREILAITTQIAEANKKDVYKEALTLEGLKDSTKNIIYANVPLEFSYQKEVPKIILVEKEPIAKERTSSPTEKIFIYDERESETLLDDKLTIHFVLPGVGLSQYLTILVEEGWNQESIYALSQWDAESQKQRVQIANTKHIQTLKAGSLEPILNITEEIINEPLNSANIYKKDLTKDGIKNPNKNIVYLDTFLLVDPAKEDIIQDTLEKIIEENYAPEKLPNLGSLLQDYFDLRAIERDIPVVENPELMSEVAKNIARQYNTIQAEGFSYDPINKNFSQEDRLVLARDLYKEAADRRQRDSYMTVEDILDLANEGLDAKITARDIREAAQETRTGLLQKQRKDRMQEIYGKFLEKDFNQSKKDFYKTLGEEYNLSPSTIYKDIRKAGELEKTQIVYDSKISDILVEK